MARAGVSRRPSGIENETLLRRVLARHRDLAGQVRAAERNVDDVVSGLQAQRRARLAMRGHEPELPVGPRLVAKYPPHETLLDVLAVLGQHGHERDLSRRQSRPAQASPPVAPSAARPSCWAGPGRPADGRPGSARGRGRGLVSVCQGARSCCAPAATTSGATTPIASAAAISGIGGLRARGHARASVLPKSGDAFRKQLQQNQGNPMPYSFSLGNAPPSAHPRLIRRPARPPLLTRAQLDGAVVAFVSRLRPHRIASRLQHRGRLGLPRGPHRGAGLIPDVPEDVRHDGSAVGEETQLEGRGLGLQGQLLRLPRLDLDVADGARVHGPVAAFHAIAAARQNQHGSRAACRDHLRRSTVEAFHAVGHQFARCRRGAGQAWSPARGGPRPH